MLAWSEDHHQRRRTEPNLYLHSFGSQALGRISGILQTGANDVLVVTGERERLIPFIAAVIRDVDLGAGVVRVEWGADY